MLDKMPEINVSLFAKVYSFWLKWPKQGGKFVAAAQNNLNYQPPHDLASNSGWEEKTRITADI